MEISRQEFIEELGRLLHQLEPGRIAGLDYLPQSSKHGECAVIRYTADPNCAEIACIEASSALAMLLDIGRKGVYG